MNEKLDEVNKAASNPLDVYKDKWVNGIKNATKFIGLILMIIGFVVFYVAFDILMNGLEVKLETEQMISFLVLMGIFAVYITMSALLFGKDLARMLPEVKEVLKERDDLMATDPKHWIMPEWLWWIKQLFTTINIRTGSILAITYLAFEFTIKPLTTDPEVIAKYTAMANGQVIMISGFALLSITTGFDRYLSKTIITLKRQIIKLKAQGAYEGKDKRHPQEGSEKDELPTKTERDPGPGFREGYGGGWDLFYTNEEGSVDGSTSGETNASGETR